MTVHQAYRLITQMLNLKNQILQRQESLVLIL